MATKKDVEVIVDEGDYVALSSGSEIKVVSLQTRQLFKLLRIITHGAGGMLLNLQISSEDSVEEFTAKLLALVAFAVPDAEDEAIEFINSVVEPKGLKKGRTLSKDDRKKNEELLGDLAEEMYNPPLEDTVTIIERIVANESEDLQALGKRLMAMFKLASKTGQLKTENN